eukprot:TRINITY_DN1891_c0_g1_i1.p1 TRINITY_DN1891_c0_g1~~TRINITY_DN1891_c0_g1_i1.p1  ORF type:complete len:274 (-),score=50.49 TRINITY_DN1891_c0_g1_i1:91-912(-)
MPINRPLEVGQEFIYDILDESRLEQTIDCFTKIWTSGNVVTTYLGIEEDDFRPYGENICKIACDQGLSIIAIDKKKDKVVGFHLSHDFDTVEYSEEFKETLDERFQVHIAFLTEMMDEYKKIHADWKYGDAINACAAGSFAEYANKGIVTKTALWAFWVANYHKYKYHFGIVTNIKTRHLLRKRARHQIIMEKNFSKWVYHGRRPFRRLKEPATAALLETTLQYQSSSWSHRMKKADFRKKRRERQAAEAAKKNENNNNDNNNNENDKIQSKL